MSALTYYVHGLEAVGDKFEQKYAIATIVLLFLFEPALLALCGTTPGKWIMGLRVTDYEDRRLTYSEAGNRTFTVFWKGMGLEIPIYSLYRNWKSYQDCEDGETLEWERETCITLRDKKNWRIWALVAAYGVIFVGLFWGISSAQMPKHRGDITVVEFSASGVSNPTNPLF